MWINYSEETDDDYLDEDENYQSIWCSKAINSKDVVQFSVEKYHEEKYPDTPTGPYGEPFTVRHYGLFAELRDFEERAMLLDGGGCLASYEKCEAEFQRLMQAIADGVEVYEIGKGPIKPTANVPEDLPEDPPDEVIKEALAGIEKILSS